MHIPSLLAKKRDGHALEQNEIEWFIQHLQDIPNEQIGAFLMACQINGLNPQETTSLTKAMPEQGERLPLREGAVDKHSTGGVGDKMSLITLHRHFEHAEHLYQCLPEEDWLIQEEPLTSWSPYQDSIRDYQFKK